MTDDNRAVIERVKALLAKATAGPWGYDSRPGTACHIWVPATNLAIVDGELAYKGGREDIADLRTGTREEDAALIVEAVNNLPRLIAMAEAGEAARAAALEEAARVVDIFVETTRASPFWEGRTTKRLEQIPASIRALISPKTS